MGASRLPVKSDGGDLKLARRLKRRDDIRRASGRRNRDEDIATAAETPHLALEYLVEPIVVANGGEDGRVGCQRNRRQWIAIEVQTGQKLTRDVLRICCTAAIAGDQELAAGTK